MNNIVEVAVTTGRRDTRLRFFPLGGGAVFYVNAESVRDVVRIIESQPDLSFGPDSSAEELALVSMAQGLFHRPHNGWIH